MQKLWKRISQSSSIAVISIEYGERPLIFLLKGCAALLDFFGAEWNVLPKGRPDRLIGGHVTDKRLDLGGREPEVPHEGLVQC